MEKIIMAVPKGRILKELNPLLKDIGIEPEEDFFNKDTRKLMFNTNISFLNIIRVRSFDVATFVAIGAAQIGIAGDDVLNEFNYEEIYNILDLKLANADYLLLEPKAQYRRNLKNKVTYLWQLNIKIQ